ncbi:MAG: hypothetical protein JWN62_3268 [Acidimicrobiales bacterium]|nr:hypothetical protein [Acidimicrobiales bacterium]
MSSDDITDATEGPGGDPETGATDDTPQQIVRPDVHALEQLAGRLAALAEPDPDDDSIWAPSAGRSDRIAQAGELGEVGDVGSSDQRAPLSGTELEWLAGPAPEGATHDAVDLGEAWIDGDVEPADDLWDVAQPRQVRARGPIVPLEIVIPIVVLALLIVVFVSWTS